MQQLTDDADFKTDAHLFRDVISEDKTTVDVHAVDGVIEIHGQCFVAEGGLTFNALQAGHVEFIACHIAANLPQIVEILSLQFRFLL